MGEGTSEEAWKALSGGHRANLSRFTASSEAERKKGGGSRIKCL